MAHDNWRQGCYLVALGIGSLIRVWGALRQSRAEVVLSRETAADLALIALASVGLVILPLAQVFTSWLDFADWGLGRGAALALGAAGAAVFGAALWLLWRAHADIGRHWSKYLQIREGHRLVTDGVYARIRHPIYAAHWLWAAAQVLLLQNWVAGPALLVTFAPIYWWRVRREERMMIEHFGDAYRSYMRCTGRVLPRAGGNEPPGGDAEA